MSAFSSSELAHPLFVFRIEEFRVTGLLYFFVAFEMLCSLLLSRFRMCELEYSWRIRWSFRPRRLYTVLLAGLRDLCHLPLAYRLANINYQICRGSMISGSSSHIWAGVLSQAAFWISSVIYLVSFFKSSVFLSLMSSLMLFVNIC